MRSPSRSDESVRLHHLVLSTVQREPLHLEVQPRRAALRVVARVGAAWIPAFAFADDHLHALVDHDEPGVVGGRVALALRALPRAPILQPTWTLPPGARTCREKGSTSCGRPSGWSLLRVSPSMASPFPR